MCFSYWTRVHAMKTELPVFQHINTIIISSKCIQIRMWSEQANMPFIVCFFYFQGYHANIVTIDHVTPLHEACLSGHVACVRALIHAGANVNILLVFSITISFLSQYSSSSECHLYFLLHINYGFALITLCVYR